MTEANQARGDNLDARLDAGGSPDVEPHHDQPPHDCCARPAPFEWPERCVRCERPISQRPIGRPRRYCSHGCRQRAYERRKLSRAVARVADRLAEARWRLACIEEDLLPLCDEILNGPPPHRPDPTSEAVADALDPVRFAERHGRWPRRCLELPRRFEPRHPLPGGRPVKFHFPHRC